MKISLLIASVGAAPFAASLLLYPKPPKIKPTPVRTEIIRVIPLDKPNTLAQRWYFPHITELKVKAEGQEVPLPQPRPVIEEAKPKPKLDLCARHGMRKVMIGKHKWRCKR
jgi:hypothetical protein